jgi:hypothetical protein
MSDIQCGRMVVQCKYGMQMQKDDGCEMRGGPEQWSIKPGVHQSWTFPLGNQASRVCIALTLSPSFLAFDSCWTQAHNHQDE